MTKHFAPGNTRYTNPLKQKFKAKRMAAASTSILIPAAFFKFYLCIFFRTVDGAGALPAPRRPNVQMPDEYLPPNKILFLQNLPEIVTKEQLTGLFAQCAPGFVVVCRQALMDSADIPIYTKFGLFPQKEILHSWSTLMREVRQWQRMLCIITSWMGRTRSRSVFLS